MTRYTLTRIVSLLGLASAAPFAPLAAQQQAEEPASSTFVQPYIEVNQVLTAQLTPGDEVLTFTQIAAGVDTTIQGRNSVASV